MRKLKASEVAAFRRELWEQQGRRCRITGQPLAWEDAVLDHDHTTGEVRGVLARGSNSMLGKIENHMRIAKLTNPATLSRFLAGVVQYISQQEYTGVMYPTHKTDEDKRLRRNRLAAKRRAIKKETTQ